MKHLNYIAHKGISAGRRGFTIYFAVLVASLALTVGVAIYDLLSRELTLSQVATQSQYAIYAADTGVECGLYWDFKYPSNTYGTAFGTSSTASWPASIETLNCANQNIRNSSWSVQSNATEATTTFTINVNTGCAIVTVAKSGGLSAPKTSVTADGRNTCSATAPLQVERTLQANY